MGFICWLLGHKIYDEEGTRVPTPKGQLVSYYATMKTSEGGFICRRCNTELVWTYNGFWESKEKYENRIEKLYRWDE